MDTKTFADIQLQPGDPLEDVTTFELPATNNATTCAVADAARRMLVTNAPGPVRIERVAVAYTTEHRGDVRVLGQYGVPLAWYKWRIVHGVVELTR